MEMSSIVRLCCLMSMEASRPIRDAEKGDRRETFIQVPTWKTKDAMDRCQNNRMLRQCLSGIVQRPPHHTTAVPTAMQNRVTKTMSVAPPLGNN